MMRTAAALLALLALAQARTLQEQGARADCTWSINGGLPDAFQALYIKPGGPLNINGFWLPQSGDVVTVPEGEQVLFACPGGTLAGPETTEALLTCSGGSTFTDASGTAYEFSTLACSRNPFHNARRVAGASCGGSADNSQVELGFELSNGDFYVIIETCFNDVTFDSIWSKKLQVPAVAGHQIDFPDASYVRDDAFYPPSLNLTLAYSVEGQIAAFAQALGSAELAGQYVTDVNYVSQGRLTAKRDNIYGSQQRVAFWNLNHAPQWEPVNEGNWDDVELSTRTFAAGRTNGVTVYTGTHGTTTLADVNGQQVPLYIAYEQGAGVLKVPAFYWRVVYDETTKQGVAFVAINNPYIDAPGDDFYLCPNVCDQIPWITWDPSNQALGYAYCCAVDALAPSVEEIPSLDVSGGLLTA